MRRLWPALAVVALLARAAPGTSAEAPPPAEAPAPAPTPAETPAAAPAATPANADLTGKPVVEVQVEGLVTVSPDQVLRAMATRKGLPFHPATYREDFTRIYNLGLFDNIVLHQPEPADGGVRVRVTCRERPIIDAIRLRGNRRVGTRALLENFLKELQEQPDAERQAGSAAQALKSKAVTWSFAAKDTAALNGVIRHDPYLAHLMTRSFERLYIEKRFPLAKIAPAAEPVPDRPGHVVLTFDIAEQEPVDIEQVVFQGRQAVKEKALLAVIQNRPGGFLRPSKPYNPDLLRLDADLIQNCYHNRGYSDARVAVLEPQISEPAGWRHRRKATITFDIQEGRLYSYGPVSFTGLTLAGEEQARKAVRLAPGRPFSDEEVRRAARRLVDLLGEYGRPFARVQTRRVQAAEPGVVGVSFTVLEGPEATVGEVRIKGNTRTADRIIRRELELFPGDIYDSRKLAASERNIRWRGIFERVQVEPVPGEEPDTADIEIEVKETETGMLQVGGFVSPDDGSVGGTIGVTERNFNWRNVPTGREDWANGNAFRGGAQSLSARAMVSSTSRNYFLTFENPWIWDTPEHYSFGFSLFHRENEFEDFQDRRTGGSLTLGRVLFHPRLRSFLQYRIQNVDISDVDAAAPEEFQREKGAHLYSSGKVGLIFDSRDNKMVTTRGWLLEADEEVFGGPFGGDRDFYKTSLEGNGFLTLFRTWNYAHVLHARVAADWAHFYGRTDFVPIEERFFAGGIGTVRGYKYRSIGPRVGDYVVGGDFRLVENLDYIFPLYQDTLRGVIFFDAGGVWPDEGEFELHDQRRSAGVGLHIRPPPAMGPIPIKLYFSHAINPGPDDQPRLFQMSFSFLF